ncbi:MAG TPA: WD40 repeat domain-containing protein [Candidatus Dormibacteraeota bacterium]|nr:WD40 repeat domain-containing protein [Candidatus Dormibacteraeota bacterium]
MVSKRRRRGVVGRPAGRRSGVDTSLHMRGLELVERFEMPVVWRIGWSSDGASIAGLSDRAAFVWSRAGGQWQRQTFSNAGTAITSELAWHPDRSLLAIGWIANRRVLLWDLEQGEMRALAGQGH